LKLLDLFCGQFGWSRGFAARGWKCVGVDLVEPAEIPAGCEFIKADVMTLRSPGYAGRRDSRGVIFFPHEVCDISMQFDFACVSSPCEEFSVFGMKHFHPEPKYPDLGIALFTAARELCEGAGIPYVMENVRPAQEFVGTAKHHCGPFYLWGNAVPPLMPQGIRKSKWTAQARPERPGNWSEIFMGTKSVRKAAVATIPIELSACVAQYAERLLEQ
jgi:hypothetical protein